MHPSCQKNAGNGIPWSVSGDSGSCRNPGATEDADACIVLQRLGEEAELFIQ